MNSGSGAISECAGTLGGLYLNRAGWASSELLLSAHHRQTFNRRSWLRDSSCSRLHQPLERRMSFSHSPHSSTSELDIMCAAYECACERLGIAQSDAIMRKRVGKLVIEQSRHGYRSSATLAYTVVKRFATAYPVPVGVDLATVG